MRLHGAQGTGSVSPHRLGRGRAIEGEAVVSEGRAASGRGLCLGASVGFGMVCIFLEKPVGAFCPSPLEMDGRSDPTTTILPLHQVTLALSHSPLNTSADHSSRPHLPASWRLNPVSRATGRVGCRPPGHRRSLLRCSGGLHPTRPVAHNTEFSL